MGSDLTVLFRICLSHLISKLSLIRSLKLLVSGAKLSNWSKSVAHSHCNRWSKISDSFTYLTCLPVKFEIPICFASHAKKCW